MNKDLRLSDIIEGKRVLLVGNSKSLLEKDYSQLIDSYEFVIRFNLAIRHLGKYPIGTKCDAWIYAMCREQVCRSTYNIAKYKPKHCIRYGNELKIGESYLNLGADKNEVRKAIGISEDMHPSTGIVTTYHLVNHCNCKSISLIGFDSFKNSNFYTHQNNAAVCHVPSKESNYLQELSDNRKIVFTTTRL